MKRLNGLYRAVFGFGVATGLCALATATLKADTCCTQCSCVNLCCSSDGCASGGIACGGEGTGCGRMCEGQNTFYYCSTYCQ
jgi:hypothetical protein